MSQMGLSRRLGHVAISPVYPKQQPFPVPVGTSHLCQERSFLRMTMTINVAPPLCKA